ncbi:MAG: alcohol dehydrogenase, partial [Armatimonadetes bacterium]|nr:alcohol dehydrogenase [Armatimonadota bacterium]
LNKKTGAVEWASGRGSSGYATPTPFTVAGQSGVAFFSGTGLAGLDPANGRPRWQFRWSTNYDVNAADPLFTSDSVFVSSGYGVGCALVRLTGGPPRPVWQNKNMRNHFHSSILISGAVYGNDDGRLRCLDLASGAEKWGGPAIGKGGLIAASGKLIILTERGELVVAEAKPDRYTELARARVVDRGECWTQPTLANGRIYARSHSGELVCVDVRAK